MTSVVTFLLLLTLTGSPTATLACVAACESAAGAVDVADMEVPMPAFDMPGDRHIADVMDTCTTLMLVIPYVGNERRDVAQPPTMPIAPPMGAGPVIGTSACAAAAPALPPPGGLSLATVRRL